MCTELNYLFPGSNFNFSLGALLIGENRVYSTYFNDSGESYYYAGPVQKYTDSDGLYMRLNGIIASEKCPMFYEYLCYKMYDKDGLTDENISIISASLRSEV